MWVGIQRGKLILFCQSRLMQSIIDRYFDASLHLVLVFFFFFCAHRSGELRVYFFCIFQCYDGRADGLGRCFEIENGNERDNVRLTFLLSEATDVRFLIALRSFHSFAP